MVRDPRNIVLSYARHLCISIEDTVKLITIGNGIDDDIMGNWSENYKSWKNFKKYNRYLLLFRFIKQIFISCRTMKYNLFPRLDFLSYLSKIHVAYHPGRPKTEVRFCFTKMKNEC